MPGKKPTSTAKLTKTINTGDRVVYDLIDPDTGMSKIHVVVDEDHFAGLRW